MEFHIVTDSSTNLSKILIEQMNIYNIDSSFNIGYIIYHMDNYLKEHNNIIYLCGKTNYHQLVELFKDMISLHPSCTINIINIDSSNIGKNNLSIKISQSNDIRKAIKDYNCESKFIYDNILI